MPAVLDQPEGPASFATAAGHRYKGEEIPSNKNSAGVLVQSINHATGENSWKVMPEDYDYNQELARAAFADMLHDSERNQLYRAGLKAAIRAKREAGEEVHVLDIGTGTGLLSMMAAVEGADSITACEEFLPMAACAEKVIRQNGFEGKIKLVRKRSTELLVGPGLDMEQRANILVTEVFDTELIGEGAIGTYNHAAAHLLTEDRVVVPGVARVWAQAVSSKRCAAWAKPLPVELGQSGEADVVLQPPKSSSSAGSSLALHDLQLSQLDPSEFTPLTDPVVVFQMDLACKEAPIPLTEQKVTTSPAIASGSCDAIFMWWDCWTDPDCSVLLSCAPSFATHHPDKHKIPWRDHWMQAIYYPQSSTIAQQGEPLSLVACHDEYSMWFDVLLERPEAPLPMPHPQPGLQMAMSRSRLGQINCASRNSLFASALSKTIRKHRKIIDMDQRDNCTILCLGEQSLLGLMAAKLGADKVIICCEENKYMRDYLLDCARQNDIADKVELVSSSWLSSTPLPPLSAVIAEPHFTTALLPWHNLHIWFLLNSINLSPSTTIMPSKCRLYLVPMHFDDLWKIRAPLKSIEGFSMDHFDQIIHDASSNADQAVEPQPLWEYPGTAMSEPVEVVEFDITKPVPGEKMSYKGTVGLDSKLPLCGVALWVDWQLDEETTVSSGPRAKVLPGSKVEWEPDSKQGVYLLPAPTPATSLSYSATFDPEEGDFTFAFHVS